ncbi:hypothetical protein HDZ31DRAFT_29305 [Schizophyllum fasciatum]
MTAPSAALKVYDLKETIDQEDLSVTINSKAGLSPPSANAVACTILQLHSASDALTPLRLFVPHRLLLIAPPPQTAQSSSLPDETVQNYLYSLAKHAEAAAVSQSCSSILAGLGSESDDFGDVAVWLGQGEYGRGHEADALKRLGFEKWATHGQISVLPPSSVLASYSQSTPELAKLAEQIAWLTDAHFFRLQVPGMSGGVVVFFYLGRFAVHGKPAGWGGLVGMGTWSSSRPTTPGPHPPRHVGACVRCRSLALQKGSTWCARGWLSSHSLPTRINEMLQRISSDVWTSTGVATTFSFAVPDDFNVENPKEPRRLTDSCGFGWRFAYWLKSQAIKGPNGELVSHRTVLEIGFDAYILNRSLLGIMDIVAQSPRASMAAASKSFDPSSTAVTTNGVRDSRDNQLSSVAICPVCEFVYNEVHDLKGEIITIDISFQNPDIHIPLVSPVPSTAARFTKSICEATLAGVDINDVEFVLPARKRLDKVTALKAVYGNREVLQGVSPYLDTLLFDDNFAEGTPREFGRYQASTLHSFDYESDSDIEEEPEEESVPGEQARSSTSEHNDIPEQEEDSRHQARPTGVVALSSTPGSFQERKDDTDFKRRTGRVVCVDGFAYQTWKSLIYYLYTGKVAFRPLRSLQDDAPSSSETQSLGVCSPKSMYRVAHMLEMPELQALCLKNIEYQLSADIIVQEAFSVFTSRYPEVSKMEIDVLKKYFKECAGERKAMMGRVARGERAHCEDVLNAMMNFSA